MGLEKVGETIGKEIVAWARTSGKSLLTTKPLKVNTCGLRYTHELKSDIFLPTSLTKKTPREILANLDLNKCISDAVKIGEGGEATVYRIKGTDFALRVHHNKVSGEKVRILDLSEGINFNITPEDEVNYIVGKFKGGEIIKYIKGEIIQGTKSEEVCRGINNLSDNSIKEYFRKILEAEKLGLYHDSFGANALFDKTTGKLIPIDFWKNKSDGILSSMMYQCRSPLINKEKLIKKSIRNLLDMCKKGEIDSKQLSLNIRENWLDDRCFATQIEAICNSFNKNKSSPNIDLLLEKLNKLDEFNPAKIEQYFTKIKELERIIEDILSSSMDILEKQKNISYLKTQIEKVQKIIKWQKAECNL